MRGTDREHYRRIKDRKREADCQDDGSGAPPAVSAEGISPPHFYKSEASALLYHYTSLAGALAILESDTLWMSDFARMNDAEEYHYARKCYLDTYHNRTVYLDMETRLAATFALLGLENNTKMFIACLSPCDEDIHQWHHYGDEGKGCAIGIDASFLQDWAGVTMRQVVYERKLFDAFMAAGLAMLQQKFEDEPEDRDGLHELAQFFVSDLYAFKHPNYRAEREVRISRLLIRDPDAPTGLEDVGGHCADGKSLSPLAVGLRDGLYGPTAFVALPLTKAKQRGIRSVTLGPQIVDPTTAAARLHSAGGRRVRIRSLGAT